jgi:ABC-2 type transport system permease protein
MPAYLRLSLAVMFQYRGEIFLWAIWGVVYPAVAMAMWSAAVAGSPNGRTIGHFGPHEFAAYFLLTMIIGHVCTAWDVYEMGHLVRTGALSSCLLRPVLPIWQSVADNLAYKGLTLTILVPIWLAVAWTTRPALAADRTHLLYGLAATALAMILNYLSCYNLAMLAFWVTRMDGVGEAWFGASLFFGGRLAPLTIMPGPIQKIASALPFKWVIWFPSEALIGHLSVSSLRGGLINQLAWIAVGLLGFRVLWRAGIKRYSAVGA